jgi:hypothetical protein
LKGKTAQLVIIVLALAIAGIVYVARYQSERIARFNRAYESIKVGDSRDAVVAAMGDPREVTDCPDTSFSNRKEEAEFRSKCFQQYKYVQWMAVYTISFDRNGTVFDKSQAVSP